MLSMYLFVLKRLRYFTFFSVLLLSLSGNTQVVSTFTATGNGTNQCPNNLFSLSADQPQSGFITYSWTVTGPLSYNQPASGKDVAFLLTTPGFYNVMLTVTNTSNNQTSTTTQNNFLTVFTPPSIDYSVTPTTGCSPLTVNFINNNPVSGETYSLNTGDGVITQSSPNFVKTYNDGGNYTPNITITSSNGCISNGNLTSVNVSPSPVLTSTTSPSAICSGTQFNYSATSSMSGTTFSWTRAAVGVNPASSGGNNVISETLLNNSSSNITASYIFTLTSSGCTRQQTVNVVVRPLPSVTINPLNPSVCSGQSTTLTSVVSPIGGTYAWSTGSNSPSIVVSNTGTYSLSYNSSGCISVVSTTVTAASPPTVTIDRIENSGIPNDGVVCVGDSYTLTAVPSVTGGTYLWSNGATTQTISGSISTSSISRTVTYNLGGCSSTATTLVTRSILPSDSLYTITNNRSCVSPLTAIFSTNYGSGHTVNWVTTGGIPSSFQTGGTVSSGVIYNSGGNFNASFTVSNSFGCQRSVNIPNAVVIGNGVTPTGSISGTPNSSVCVNTNYCLNYTASGADTIIVNWGNGTQGYSPNTTNFCRNYSVVGNVTITITPFKVQNGVLICPGSSSSHSLSVIGNSSSFTVSTLECDNQRYRCYTRTSIDASPLTVYTWSFGDGSPNLVTNNQTVCHTFSNFSSNSTSPFIVTLTASDNANSCPQSQTSRNIFAFRNDGANFQFRKPNSSIVSSDACLNDTLQLWNITPIPQRQQPASNSNTIWNLNDINPNYSTATSTNTASGRLFVFTNPASGAGAFVNWNPGVYNVGMVNVRANEGLECRDTVVKTNFLKVHGVIPGAIIPSQVCANTSLIVTDTSTAPASFVRRRTWNWGDGSPNTIIETADLASSVLLSNRQTNHIYTTTGAYTITLTIEDDFGCAPRVISRTINVVRPNSSFNLDRNFVCPNQTVSATSTSTGSGPLVYSWTTSNDATITSPTLANTTVSFSTEGTKTLTLTTTDINGCSHTSSLPIDVYNPIPSAIADPITVSCFNPPSIVTFTNNSSQNIDPTYAQWNFNVNGINNGDGVNPATSNTYNPSVTYDLAGTYTISLTVKSLSGCFATSNVATVNIGGPVGSVIVNSSVKEGCSCLPINLTVNTQNATQATLLFGDGQFLTLTPNTTQTISHSYCNGGNSTLNFQPSVYVVNGTCNGFIPAADVIIVDPVPTATISYPNSTYCLPSNTTIPVTLEGVGSYLGGAYSATPSGLNINSTTGAIDLSNTAPGNYTITYTVAPTSVCPTINATTNLTITQTPIVTGETSATICSEGTFNIVPTGTIPLGTTYTWSTPTTSGTISGAVAQSTPVSNISQSLSIAASVTVSRTATYTVTAINGNCSTTFTAVVTVNPRPSVSNQTTSTCSGLPFVVSPTGVPIGTQYTWTVGSVIGGITGQSPQSTLQNSISQTLTAGITSGSVVYNITPSFQGCTGSTFTATVNVSPTPNISAQSLSICSGNSFSQNPSNVTPVNYSWALPTINPIGSVSGASALNNQSTFSQTLTSATGGTAFYTVTASSGTCSTTFTSSINVQLRPSISNQTHSICSGTSFNLTPGGSGVTYSWAAPTLSNIASASAGTDSPSISGNLSLSNPLLNGSASYTVTPSLAGCTGNPFNLIVTVNAVPSSIPNQATTVCSGLSFHVSPSHVPAATTYTWSAPSMSGVTGGTLESNPQPSISQILTGSGSATYTVTPNNLGCNGNNFNVSVTVNPRPEISNQTATICSNTSFTISPSGVPVNTSYAWAVPVMTPGVSGGSASSGFPSVSQSLSITSNPTPNPGTATYIVTPTFGSCIGTTFNATVTVNPLPVFTMSKLDPSTCGGTNGRITVSGLPASSPFQYEYVVNPPTVVVGPIVTTNAGGNLLISDLFAGNYAVTIINPTTNCRSIAQNIILVNPNAPVVSDIVDQVLCGGCFTLPLISGTNLTGNQRYYSQSGGVGDSIPVGTSLCNSQIVYIYDEIGIGCTSQQSFNITINTVPSLSNKSITICSGESVTLNFGLPDVIPSGTTYSWSAPTYSGGASGGNSLSGQSNFSQSGLITGLNVGSAVYSVTATAGSCSSTFTVVVTINPTPSVNNQTTSICSNGTFTISPTGVPTTPNSTTYFWSSPTISPLGSISGHSAVTSPGNPLISQTLTLSPVGKTTASTASYTVTPRTGTCNGLPFNVLVTVNPVPIVNSSSLTICSGETLTFSPTSVPETPPTTYTWPLPTVSGVTGGGASIGTPSSFVQILNGSGTAGYVVTPTSGSCVGNSFNINVTINPTPVVSNLSTTVCSNSAFVVSPSSSVTGTTYVWSQPTYSPLNTISGGSSGSTSNGTISQTLINTSGVLATATYTVTPVSGSCNGTTFTLTVNVTPEPSIASPQTVTTNSGVPVTVPIAGSIPSPTSYSWSTPSYSGSLSGGEPGSGTSMTQTLVNSSVVPHVATYTVTPTHNTCEGQSFQVEITVDPCPEIAPQTATICSGQTFSVTPSPVPSSTTYTWSQPIYNPSGSISGGSQNFTPVPSIAQTLTGSGTAIYSVTAVSGTCSRTFAINVTVNQNPNLSALPINPSLCNGTDGSINLSGLSGNTAYTYSINTVPSSGSFTSSPTGTTSILSLGAGSYSLQVTQVNTSCLSNTVNVNLINPASPNITNVQNVSICGDSYVLPAISGTNLTGADPAYFLSPNRVGSSISSLSAPPTTTTVYVNATTPGGCFDEKSFTVTFNPIPIVSAPQTVCQDGTGSLTSNSTGTWQALGLQASVSGNNFNALQSTNCIQFQFTENITGCQATTNCVEIKPRPVINAGSSQTVCSTTSSVSLSATSSGTVTNYSWSDGSTGGSFSPTNSLATNYLLPALDFVVLTITGSDASGVCPNVTSNLTININSAPVAFAGNDASVCSNNGTISLSGTYFGVATSASWAVLGQGPFSFDNNTSYTIPINPPSYIDFEFCTNDPIGPCVAACDIARITIETAPTVNAGPDYVACSDGNCFELNTPTIGGSASSFFWFGGLGSFDPNIGASATYCPVESEILTGVTLTVFTNTPSTVCAAVQDEVSITFNPPARITASVADDTVCSTEQIALSGILSGSAVSGCWTVFEVGGVSDPSVYSASTNFTNSCSINTNYNIPAGIPPTYIIFQFQTNDPPGVCPPGTDTIRVVINPTPVILNTNSTFVCDGEQVVLALEGDVPASFTWNAIAPGNPNVIGETFTSQSTSSITDILLLSPANHITTETVQYSITPFVLSTGCVGSNVTVNIEVRPKPLMNQVDDQLLCSNTLSALVDFSSNISGTTYQWDYVTTPSVTHIGNGSNSGQGNIPSFTTLSTFNQVVADFTVTPTFNSCSGASENFVFTIKPISTVDPIQNINVCGGETISDIIFSGNNINTIYSWTSSNPLLGLPASSSGNILSFVAPNSSSTYTSTITVTPVLDGCNGITQTFTVTVRPTPVILSLPNRALCRNNSFAQVDFTSVPSGVSYSWGITDASTIGAPVSGSTSFIPSFIGLNSNTNGDNTIGIANILATLNGCVSTPISFTYTVYPDLRVDPISDITVCAGENIPTICFTGNTPSPPTQYNWQVSNTSIFPNGTFPINGNPFGGTGCIASFNTSESFDLAVCRIIVTPSLPGCVGVADTFLINVKPKPNVVVNPGNQSVCGLNNFQAVLYSGNIPGTNFCWTTSNVQVWENGSLLSPDGCGNIPVRQAKNVLATPQTAFVRVWPEYDGCYGDTVIFTLTANPAPTLDAISDQQHCHDTQTSVVNLSSGGLSHLTSYQWYFDRDILAGLPPHSGSTSVIPSFTTENNMSNLECSNVIVTPFIGGCAGNSGSFQVCVAPNPVVYPVSSQNLCAGDFTAPVTFQGWGATGFAWTNNNTGIGYGGAGVDFIPQFQVNGSQTAEFCARPNYVITTTSPNLTCYGSPICFQITSTDPKPVVIPVGDISLCVGECFNDVIFAGNHPNNTYNWSHNNGNFGIPLSGSNSFPGFCAPNLGNQDIITPITVLPTRNGCSGDPIQFNITVKPTPNVVLSSPSSQTYCSNNVTNDINFFSGVSGTCYSWTATNTSFVSVPNSLSASGTTCSGIIPGFATRNTSFITQTSLITITPTLNGCIGTSEQLTISVNPFDSIATPNLDSIRVCAGTLFGGLAIQTMHPDNIKEWRCSNPSLLGLPIASGWTLGDIPPFTPDNTLIPLDQDSVSVCFEVRPKVGNCYGQIKNFCFWVKRKPNAVPMSNLAYCACDNALPINFNSNPPSNDVQYFWQHNNQSIGLTSSSGIGNIAGWSLPCPLTGVKLIQSNFEVTPVLNGCQGDVRTFTFSIGEKPTMILGYDNIILCHGELIPNNTIAISPSLNGNATSPNYTWSSNYNWSSSSNLQTMYGAGLTSQIESNPIIPSVSSTAIAQTPYCGTITATPRTNYSIGSQNFSCTGDSRVIDICLKPTPVATQHPNLMYCAGQTPSPITFIHSGVPAGAPVDYTWSYTTPSPLVNIGLPFNSTAYGNPTNPINWLVNIPETTPTTTATFTVIPSLEGCTGDPMSFDLTVKEKPFMSLNPSELVLCHGDLIPNIVATYSSASAPLSDIKLEWTSSLNLTSNWNPTLGTPAAISNNPIIATNNPIANNSNSPIPLIGSILTRPELNGCFGDYYTVPVTIKPTPVISAQSSFTYCAGQTASPITFTSSPTGSTVSYSWSYTTSPTPGINIGIDAVGSGNIPTFDIPVTTPTTQALFTVTASIDGCPGIPMNFSILIKEKPNMQLDFTNLAICHGDIIPDNLATFSPTSTGIPPTLEWTASSNLSSMFPTIPTIQSSNPITASSSSSGINLGAIDLCGIITASPLLNGCYGDAQPVNYCIKPRPNVFQVASQTVCSGTNTSSITFSGNHGSYGGNTIYEWSVSPSSVDIGIPGHPQGNTTTGILGFNAIGGVSTHVSTLTVTPTLNGCIGSPMSFSYIVHPDLTLGGGVFIPSNVPVSDLTICAGECVDAMVFNHPNSDVVYEWNADFTTIYPTGYPQNGNDTIPGECTVSLFNTPVINTLTVTPKFASCIGQPILVSITMNPTPRVDPTPDFVLCDDSNLPDINFGSSFIPNAEFNWECLNCPPIGLFPPTTGNSTINSTVLNNPTSPVGGDCTPGIPLIATIKVTPIYNNCVGIIDTFSITVNPRPVVVAGPDVTVCMDQCMVPSVLCLPSNPIIYTWDNGAATNVPYCPIDDITLTLTGIDANLCTNQDVLQVTYIQETPPAIFAGENDTLCFGECITIVPDYDGGFPNWSIDPTISPFCPPSTNVYILTVTSLNGCVSVDSVQIIVNPLPEVLANASATTLCEGENLTLWGAGALTYDWTDPIQDGVSFVASPSGTNTYEVIGTDANGCQNTATIDVIVNPLPNVLWSADIQNGGCLPFETCFTNLSSPGLGKWDFGNGEIRETFEDRICITYNDFGCYPVSLVVTTAEGCVDSLRQENYICINPVISQFTPNVLENSIASPDFCFTNESVNGYSFLWDFGNIPYNSYSTITHPCFSYDSIGLYTVCLVAYSGQQNCSDTFCTTIRVLDQILLYVPNTFTPDGNGLNETFKPVLTSGFDPNGIYEFLIYNRWGEVIFESNEFKSGWDGLFNGEKVQNGTYSWTIKFKDSQNNKIHRYNGHVNLIR
jgi:gliding motility-associated-like protein